ncbi:MAG: DUF2220 domain-containing protein [Candidatus Accumulibacter sp.]|jgi:hypothetical protein|nr:DUF2220 domain-containing protein [Accumulibacter sp.]
MNDEGFAGMREPAVAALLNALVDRIDAKPFAERARALSFPLDAENWPAFFAIDLPGERAVVWKWLETLSGRPGFALKLDERKRWSDLDVLERRPRLVVTPEAEKLLRAATGRHPRDTSWSRGWRKAVQARFGESELADRLLARPIAISQRAPEEILARFIGIAALAESSLMLHEVASRQFWGLSKILNGQQESVALLLQAARCPFPDKPVQLLVAARADDAEAPILFIENAATFESLAAGRMEMAQGFLLVFASGYRAVARRLRAPGGSSVYFAPRLLAGNAALPGRFLDWLYSERHDRPLYFWGDLDFSGMDILKELRVVFPEARAWQPGYQALLALLDAGESHAPDEAGKSGQADPGQTGCPYADDVLLPALRRYGRFVDQESL